MGLRGLYMKPDRRGRSFSSSCGAVGRPLPRKNDPGCQASSSCHRSIIPVVLLSIPAHHHHIPRCFSSGSPPLCVIITSRHGNTRGNLSLFGFGRSRVCGREGRPRLSRSRVSGLAMIRSPLLIMSKSRITPHGARGRAVQTKR